MRCEDPLLLRLVCAELAARRIAFRVEGEAMNALLHVGDMLAPRLLVEGCDVVAARRIIDDLTNGEQK